MEYRVRFCCRGAFFCSKDPSLVQEHQISESASMNGTDLLTLWLPCPYFVLALWLPPFKYLLDFPLLQLISRIKWLLWKTASMVLYPNYTFLNLSSWDSIPKISRSQPRAGNPNWPLLCLLSLLNQLTRSSCFIHPPNTRWRNHQYSHFID